MSFLTEIQADFDRLKLKVTKLIKCPDKEEREFMDYRMANSRQYFVLIITLLMVIFIFQMTLLAEA